MTRYASLTAALLAALIAGSVYAHTIWTGKITDGQYTQTATDAQWVYVDGDNSRLYVSWDSTSRAYLLHLDPSEKHRTTDGAIPNLYIQPTCSNQVLLVPRFTN